MKSENWLLLIKKTYNVLNRQKIAGRPMLLSQNWLNIC
jgi:hypothetical protein